MRTHVTRVSFVLAAMLVLAGAFHAQGLPKDKGALRITMMFNVLCLSQLPDLAGVAKAAGFGEFAPINGKELEQYQPAVPVDELHAWSFHDSGGKYVLTAARSKPDAEFQKTEPGFAKSTSMACSLLFPAAEPKEAMLKQLTLLLGHGPDKSWDEGPMRVHSWNGRTDKLLSRVHYYAPAKSGPTGMLSATIFVKD
jgi:hypothetical protein